MSGSSVVHTDPEILGGTPVFVGTRVPLRNLIDYLEGGYSLDAFLDDFPSVSRVQAVAALELPEQGFGPGRRRYDGDEHRVERMRPETWT